MKDEIIQSLILKVTAIERVLLNSELKGAYLKALQEIVDLPDLKPSKEYLQPLIDTLLKNRT